MKIFFKRTPILSQTSLKSSSSFSSSLSEKHVVTITNSMMDKTKPIIEKVKKRGRPSKKDIEQKAKEKLELENKIKDELQKKAATITPGTVVYVNNTSVSVDIPIFKVGDYVKDKTGISKFVHKGIVVRHDVGSRFVCVDWKDGSRQWHAATSLEKITYKEYKKRERNEFYLKSLSEEVETANLSDSDKFLVDVNEQDRVYIE